MSINEPVKNIIIRFFISIITLIIIGIYYSSELRPFHYDGYEKNINRLQRFDAELNESIVLTRFGLLGHYDPIDKALDGMHKIISTFKSELNNHPHPALVRKLDALESALNHKEALTQNFKRINPILTNAINQFSTILALIIESQASIQLVESCLEQDYRYQIVDKINNLFRGILIYINLGTIEQHQQLVDLVADIRQTPHQISRLNLALSYADKILDLQPKMSEIDTALFEVPIVPKLNLLNETYNEIFQTYLSDSFTYRVLLYVLVFVLLVALRWAFSQLRGTVNALHVEVHHKIKAQRELAEINRQLEQRVEERTHALTAKNKDLNQALAHLKEAQDQLIIQEKMASLGMLTTGIAHEIQNPLNFVNNFSDLSVELLSELSETLIVYQQKGDQESLSIIKDTMADLTSLCQKIKAHGERADNIVKNMLLHSRTSNTKQEIVDIQNLIEENYTIAMRSFLSEHADFDVTLVKDFDGKSHKMPAYPQAMARALIYLLDNAFYAMQQKQNEAGTDYVPTLKISLYEQEKQLVIKIRDNGKGIAKKQLDKVFEPFFTTKPTGKGNTGLGLSICYDTIVKQHKGQINVTAQEGIFTEFTLILPIGQ